MVNVAASMLHIQNPTCFGSKQQHSRPPFSWFPAVRLKAAKKCAAEAWGTAASSGGWRGNLITRDRRDEGEIKLPPESFCQTITLGCELYWGRYRYYITVSNCVADCLQLYSIDIFVYHALTQPNVKWDCIATSICYLITRELIFRYVFKESDCIRDTSIHF